MSEPDFNFDGEVKPQRRAPIGGWVSLFVLLGLLCVGSLSMSFKRSDSPQREFFQVSREYRMWVLQHEASSRFGLLRQASGDTISDSLGTSLDDLISRVAPDRKSSPDAARLYVSMRHEKGVAIKPEDLDLLRKSTKAEERNFAKVYASEKLTPEAASQINSSFPEQGFSYKMARIHALEKSGDKKAREKLLPNKEIVQPTVGIVVWLSAFAIGVVMLTVYVGLRLSGRFKPLGHPAGEINAEQADSFAGTAALLLFAFLAINLAADYFLGSLLPGESASILSGFLTIGATIFLLTKGRRLHGPGMWIYGIEKGKIAKDVLWGVCGFFAGVPLFMTCACMSQFLFSGLPAPDHPITFEIQADKSLPMLLIIVGVASVIAPIFEETCFRGIITPATHHLFGGPSMGIVASSLAFAMIHPQGIGGWLPLAMIGGTAAMLTYQRKSLVPAIVFHAVHNCFVLLMNVLLL